MSNLSEISWQEGLPEIYRWLGKVKLSKNNQIAADSPTIVAVKAPSNGEQSFSIDTKSIDDTLKKNISEAASSIGWLGKSGSQTVAVGEQKFILVSTSKLSTTPVQKSRQLGLDACSQVKGRSYKSLTILEDSELAAIDCWEGLCLGLFNLQSFKGKKEETADLPEEISLVGGSASEADLEKSRATLSGIMLARALQDAPPNWLDSERFAEIAEGISSEVGIKCTVFGRKELKEKGMGSFLSVAGGTERDPKMIVMEIEGEDTSKTRLIVGKGLTFDAGGISIKPSIGMDEMKYDMSGGAAVMGVARALAGVKPKTNVVCIIGATENMVGHDPTRPGDIVRAYNGKTIEVLNTDAEGRLVLADCLAYGNETYKPEFIIDAATLTGAVLHGLGSAGAALISNDQGLADQLLLKAREVGEPYWQLPLWPELNKEVKAEVADLKNIAAGSVKAGTIIGAVFLKEFVGETKWAHLDIAGTAWNCKATGFPGAGSSGFGVRLMMSACLM